MTDDESDDTSITETVDDDGINGSSADGDGEAGLGGAAPVFSEP